LHVPVEVPTHSSSPGVQLVRRASRSSDASFDSEQLGPAPARSATASEHIRIDFAARFLSVERGVTICTEPPSFQNTPRAPSEQLREPAKAPDKRLPASTFP
jgi:hypothetical protein